MSRTNAATGGNEQASSRLAVSTPSNTGSGSLLASEDVVPPGVVHYDNPETHGLALGELVDFVTVKGGKIAAVQPDGNCTIICIIVICLVLKQQGLELFPQLSPEFVRLAKSVDKHVETVYKLDIMTKGDKRSTAKTRDDKYRTFVGLVRQTMVEMLRGRQYYNGLTLSDSDLDELGSNYRSVNMEVADAIAILLQVPARVTSLQAGHVICFETANDHAYLGILDYKTTLSLVERLAYWLPIFHVDEGALSEIIRSGKRIPYKMGDRPFEAWKSAQTANASMPPTGKISDVTAHSVAEVLASTVSSVSANESARLGFGEQEIGVDSFAGNITPQHSKVKKSVVINTQLNTVIPPTPTKSRGRPKSERKSALSILRGIPGNDDFHRCSCQYKPSEGTEGERHLGLFHHIVKAHPGWDTKQLVMAMNIFPCVECGMQLPLDASNNTMEHDCIADNILTRKDLTESKRLDEIENRCGEIQRHIDATEVAAEKIKRMMAAPILVAKILKKHTRKGTNRLHTAQKEDRVFQKLGEGNHTEAIRALFQTGIAHPTKEEINAKFPRRISPEVAEKMALPKRKAKFQPITRDQILKYIETRQSVSATGTDGNSLYSLKRLLERPHQGKNLLGLYNLLWKEEAFDQTTILTQTEVKNVNLVKGKSFRPIGVGLALERVRQGIIVSRNKRLMNDEVLDQNDYTLRPSGTSIVICSSQVLVEDNGCIARTQDLENAFNATEMAKASKVFEAAGADEMADLTGTLQVHRVQNEHGSFLSTHIPQGSSAGSCSMAAVMTDLLKEPRAQHAKKSAILTVADDITTLSKSGAFADEVVEEIAKRLPENGLRENVGKRGMYDETSQQALKVVGAYIGTKEQVTKALEAEINATVTEVETFTQLVDGYAVAEQPIRQTALHCT